MAMITSPSALCLLLVASSALLVHVAPLIPTSQWKPHRHHRQWRRRRRRLLCGSAPPTTAVEPSPHPELWFAHPPLDGTVVASTEEEAAVPPVPSKSKSSEKSKKRPRRSKPIPYVACSSTIELTRAASKYLRPGDSVLELGSQSDKASSAICDAVGPTGHATLVDIRRTASNSGRSSQGERDADKFRPGGQYDDRARFVELAEFGRWRDVLLPDDNNDDGKGGDGQRCYDALVLDVSATVGNDLALTALSTVAEFVARVPQSRARGRGQRNDNDEDDDGDLNGVNAPIPRRPRVVLLKSTSLSDFARRLVHAQRLFDGTESLSSPRRRNFDGSKPLVVAAVGVEEYRRTIPHAVRRGDAAIEVGCFSGSTTALLQRAVEDERECDNTEVGFAVGVDIGSSIIKTARHLHPDVQFEVGDAWRTLDLLRLRCQQQLRQPRAQSSTEEGDASGSGIILGYDVVYADIGGLSGPDGVLETLALIDSLGNALGPRCIVVKSLCLRRLASSLRSFSDVWERENLGQEVLGDDGGS